MKELLEKLKYVQQNLKAPKNQTNKFGGYNYRSCEDIFEAVKPLLDEQKLALTLEDELIQIGERYYVKATARLYDVERPFIHFDSDCDGLNEITNTAYAREEETKKGMDGSQITGTASSYARKYALNGLFLIDDQKDADTDEYQKQEEKKATEKQITILEEKCTDEEIEKIYEKYKIEKLEDLSMEIASKLISRKLGNG